VYFIQLNEGENNGGMLCTRYFTSRVHKLPQIFWETDELLDSLGSCSVDLLVYVTLDSLACLADEIKVWKLRYAIFQEQAFPALQHS
jgi:hypothetical protein